MPIYVMQPDLTAGDAAHVRNQLEAAAKLYAAPGISGVLLHGIKWADVAPSPGVYDWATLDQTLNQLPAGFGLTLVLTAGFYCPAWLTASGAAPAVKVRVNTSVHGDAEVVALPIPYSDAFQAEYATAVGVMVAHVQSTYPALLITGFVASLFHGIDGEMTLPCSVDNKSVAENDQAWADAGYRPAAVRTAWLGFVETLATALPTDCALEIPPLAPSTCFPWVDDAGVVQSDYGDACRALTLSYLTTLAVAFGARVRAVFVSLSTDPIPSFFTAAVDGGCSLGVQTNTWGGTFSVGPHNNPTPGTEADFTQALRQAAATGVSYVELHPGDVTAFPDVVASMAPVFS